MEKGDCVWVTHVKQRSLHKYPRVERGQEHDRSSAGEEGYAVISAGCEGKRNETRPLRPTFCTM